MNIHVETGTMTPVNQMPLTNTDTFPPWYEYYQMIQPAPLTRNYKCPCKGEFFMPATKDGKQVCPFCSVEMKGLNP
jgi:hypothetical protein